MSASDTMMILGDCRDILKGFVSESFDSMVTDPPAGIAFMGAEWDTHTLDGFEDFLAECFLEAYRVLKPGAHILVWSIPRTSYRTACAIERAGFVIRDGLDNIKDRSAEVEAFLDSLTEDQVEMLLRAGPADSFILHMFGQGFPKGLNVQKALAKLGSEEAAQWDGFGTALKPAVETWWLARKPLREKTVVDQVLATGTGALNIDGCRVAGDMSELINPGTGKPRSGMGSHYNDEGGFGGEEANPPNPLGRWPANVTLQHGPDCRLVGSKKVKGVHTGPTANTKAKEVVFGGYTPKNQLITHVDKDGHIDWVLEEYIGPESGVGKKIEKNGSNLSGWFTDKFSGVYALYGFVNYLIDSNYIQELVEEVRASKDT